MTRPAPPRRPPLVLVVDDEPGIVTAYTKILEYEGFAAVPARSAEDALRLLQSGLRPDAILLDLRMPGMGGLGCLLAIRAQEGCAGIPVAVITSDVLDDGTQHAVEALGATFWYRPLNVAQVVTIARQVLNARAHVPRADSPVPSDADPCRACPRCGDRDIALTLVTSFGSYYQCRSCGHSWHDRSLERRPDAN